MPTETKTQETTTTRRETPSREEETTTTRRETKTEEKPRERVIERTEEIEEED